MVNLDSSQNRVLELDTSGNAVILGAPGSGKTVTLVQTIKHLLQHRGFSLEDILVLSSNRRTVAKLRELFEENFDEFVPSGIFNTPEAYAFSLLKNHHAKQGSTAPKLLTGAVQDDLIKTLVAKNLHRYSELLGLSEEVISSSSFRTELRDFERLVHNYGLNSELFHEYANNPRNLVDQFLSDSVAKEISTHFFNWGNLLVLLADIEAEQSLKFASSFSASQLLFRVKSAIMAGELELVSPPKLILIDDAQDLAKGAQNLLDALVLKGSRVWAFGDRDASSSTFEGKTGELLTDVPRALSVAYSVPENTDLKTQKVILEKVHRHSQNYREFATKMTNRIGATMGVEHRKAVGNDNDASIQFAVVDNQHDLLSVTAYRLRAAKLGVLKGLDRSLLWNEMAVVCRSREEVDEVQKALNQLDVPTKTNAGGIILKDTPITRDLLRLLILAYQPDTQNADQIEEILLGPLVGFDRVSLRKLIGELLRLETNSDKEKHVTFREILFETVKNEPEPEKLPVNKRFATFITAFREAQKSAREGDSARETLWKIWSTLDIADDLRETALNSSGISGFNANNNLDAVINLFYVFQRYEEQADETPIIDFINDALTSEIAQDTLAETGQKDAVLVSTPQGITGEEFELVCVAGLQEGVWPNLKPRGSILELSLLENIISTGFYGVDQRTQLLHDELRLLYLVTTKSRSQLLVLSVSSEDDYPSPFFALGKDYLVTGLPKNRLSMRGFIAAERRKLEKNPESHDAAKNLAILMAQEISGADPQDWYGVKGFSTDENLFTGDEEKSSSVPVSPSKIESIEECPLNWFINDVGGAEAEIVTRLGTLLHAAFETAAVTDFESAKELVVESWSSLEYDAEWLSKKDFESAQQMMGAIKQYLDDQKPATAAVMTESFFELKIENVTLRGFVDRIEIAENSDGKKVPVVIDLKTGASLPSLNSVGENAQLQAYQAGLLHGEFHPADGSESVSFNNSAGAKLLFVNPKAQKVNESYRLLEQKPMTEEDFQVFKKRVIEVSEVMTKNVFEANVEHHCTATNRTAKSCTIHIIPPVSSL